MNTSVTNPDSSAPSAPGALSAVGGLSSASAVVGGSDRQRGRCPLQRPPRHERRVHAVGRRTGSRSRRGSRTPTRSRRDLLLPGGRRGRCRQSRAGLERGARPRSAIRRRRLRRGRWRRWGRSGGRRCRGRRRPTTSVCCATTSIAVRARGSRPRLPTGSRSRPTPGYVDTTAPGSYFYKVTAEDAAGNISAVSNEAVGDGDGRHDGAEPAGRACRLGRRQHRQPQLDRLPDNVGCHPLQPAPLAPLPASRRSAANRIAQPTGPSYADTGLATGSYFYKVTAEDAAGNISAASNEATATVADATPPTAPSSLAATVAGSTVNLSWAAATDNVGVSRYNLHRGTTSGFTPSPANRIAQPTGLSYADTGVSPGSYFYKLTAEDAAGNISPVSNTATRHRRSTPARPAHPTNLAATGGAGQASLTWTAATDNVAVTRYNLHRSTSSGFTPTPATASRNPPAPATPTPASPPAPTTTSSPPKTPPATSAPPQTKPPPPSAPHPSPASSPPTASTPAAAPPPPTNPAPATTAPSPTPPGPDHHGKYGKPSPSTAPTPPSPSPTPTASTSPPA